MIERQKAPNRLDIQPYGTIVKVFSETEDIKYFIQLGTEDTIMWRPISHMFDIMFKHLYEDPEFINELLNQFEDCDRPIKQFTDMIITKF